MWEHVQRTITAESPPLGNSTPSNSPEQGAAQAQFQEPARAQAQAQVPAQAQAQPCRPGMGANGDVRPTARNELWARGGYYAPDGNKITLALRATS